MRELTEPNVATFDCGLSRELLLDIVSRPRQLVRLVAPLVLDTRRQCDREGFGNYGDELSTHKNV